MAEGVGFEPTVELPLLLISSQVPLTTQPPFHLKFRRPIGVVRIAGLEPARLAALPPQSSVSANSTISALGSIMKQGKAAKAS